MVKRLSRIASALRECSNALHDKSAGGGVLIIVVDAVNGGTLEQLKRSRQRPPPAVFRALNAAVETLQKQELVPGVLRAVNIMIVDGGKHARIIDFDWTAKHKEGR